MATLAQHIDAPQVSGAYKVDISRGRNIGRVSSEWYSRPDDEKFLSLDDLYENVRRRATAPARGSSKVDVRVEASMDNAERLSLIVPGEAEPIAPTNWSFGQLSSLAALPPPICGVCPPRSPASISSTACSRTAASR
jgi:hypothetical protein